MLRLLWYEHIRELGRHIKGQEWTWNNGVEVYIQWDVKCKKE